MTRAVRLTSAAERDLAAAFHWYEEQSAGLGARLLARVDDLLARVAETPLQFPEVVRGYRRGLLQRFPYGLYFSIDSDEVRVHAVLHLHRDPKHWQDRVSGSSI